MTIDHRTLSRTLARMAATLHEPYSLREVIATLSADVASLVDVDGAGVMVADDDGELRFVSSSDSVLGELEALQIRLGEGPCLLAYQSGEMVLADDLSSDPRFPRFGPLAQHVGLRAVYSFPMRVASQVVGATNLYAGTPRRLSGDEVEAVAMLTDAASSYLLHADASERSQRLNDQLQRALDRRVVVEQAKGFLAARTQGGVDEAWEALRRYARDHNLNVQHVATEVLAGRVAVDEVVTRSTSGR